MAQQAERLSKLSPISSKGTNLIMRAPTSWPDDLPKALPPHTVTWGISLQHMSLEAEGDANSQSIAVTSHVFLCGSENSTSKCLKDI